MSPDAPPALSRTALTLDRLVRLTAARRPHAPAVRSVDGDLDYATLDAHADAFAAWLRARGVEPGDRVALWAPKSLAGVAAIIGALRAGAAYLPIDPTAPLERARLILEHCGARLLLVAGAPATLLERAADGERPTLPVFALALPDGDADPTSAQAAHVGRAPLGVDLAYVLYTSGSTGRPKGVALTHAQSLAFVEPATEVFGLTGDDVLASHAPFNFDLSTIDLFCTFRAGASVALLPERALAFPSKVVELIARFGVTVWNSVPSALVQLTQHGKLGERGGDTLRLVMFAGEPYPLVHLRVLRAALPSARLLNVYGQTEANSSTWYEIHQLPPDGAPLPIGKTFPNYEVFVLDLDGRRVDTPGVEGELYVRGGAVASGYFRDPERTAAAFVQHPLDDARHDVVYRTGDRVAWDANGDLVFHGRADAVVKVSGHRVELGELESVALAVPGVSSACAIAVPDVERTNRLVLFYVGAEVTPAGLTAALAARLARATIPERVCLREAFPATPNGKVDRRALLDEARAALAEAP